MGMFARTHGGYYHSYSKPKRFVCVRDDDGYPYEPYKPSGGHIVTSKRQTCAACGKFRSAKWEAAHPLVGGVAVNAICGRCKRKDTSSEEKESRHYQKRCHHRHHSRHPTSSTEASCCSYRDRPPGRYRSCRSHSRECSHHRAKASPKDNVRIVIANQPGDRFSRASSRSSSVEGVRLIRRSSFVELPERVRTRSRARSSSCTLYIDDDGAEVVRARRRPMSRSYSRGSFIEELDIPRKRKKRRSSSRVQFVDDLEKPVLVGRPRCISRRRAIYFDGAASFEGPEQEESRYVREPRGRSRQRSSSIRRRIPTSGESEGGVRLIEEIITPLAQKPSLGWDKQDRDESIEEIVIPRRRTIAETERVASITHAKVPRSMKDRSTGGLDEVYYHQPNHSRSDHTAFARTESQRPSCQLMSDTRTLQYPQISASRKRPRSDTTHSVCHGGSTALGDDSPHPAQRPHSYSSLRPVNKRRRTYHNSSSDDENRLTKPISYRHVRAPSPPSTDYLSQMLRSSHITPPRRLADRSNHLSDRQGDIHTPPSPPASPSWINERASSPKSPTYRPPVFWAFSASRHEHGHGSVPPSPAESNFRHEPEYEMQQRSDGADAQYDEWVREQSRAAQGYNWMH